MKHTGTVLPSVIPAPHTSRMTGRRLTMPATVSLKPRRRHLPPIRWSATPSARMGFTSPFSRWLVRSVLPGMQPCHPRLTGSRWGTALPLPPPEEPAGRTVCLLDSADGESGRCGSSDAPEERD